MQLLLRDGYRNVCESFVSVRTGIACSDWRATNDSIGYVATIVKASRNRATLTASSSYEKLFSTSWRHENKMNNSSSKLCR